jgi:Transglutaminase-like superfamily
MKRPLVQFLWSLTNTLLILSFAFLLYSIGWEYSTRNYLKGFSDAIMPANESPEAKIEAILNWMEHGPSRRTSPEAGGLAPLRNPQETLNYRELLRVCGTATNAFVNIANSGGLPSRRLLLLDEHRVANHVVAEVKVDGRWIVVDPVFRAILRGPQGQLLTRRDLRDPIVFHEATRNLRDYLPLYDYDITAHVRLSRIPVIGRLLRSVLDRVAPGWEDSIYWTLLLERESFAALWLALFLFFFLVGVRFFLRWYGESRLGLRRARLRNQLLRAARAFLGEST